MHPARPKPSEACPNSTEIGIPTSVFVSLHLQVQGSLTTTKSQTCSVSTQRVGHDAFIWNELDRGYLSNACDFIEDELDRACLSSACESKHRALSMCMQVGHIRLCMNASGSNVQYAGRVLGWVHTARVDSHRWGGSDLSVPSCR